MSRCRRRWFALLAPIVALSLLEPVATASARPHRPVITSVSASSGSSVGVAHVVIRGRYLAGATVTVGGRKTYARVLSSKLITAFPAGHRHGRTKIVVRTAAGTSKGVRYTYVYARPPARWSAKASRGFSASECPVIGTCISVGGTVARIASGGREKFVNIPEPADAFVGLGSATDLSCVSAAFCAAVGTYTPKGGASYTFAGFLSTWNGSTWSTVRAPRPTGSNVFDGNRYDVSCGAAGSCVAITDDRVYTFANGTWTGAVPVLQAGTSAPRLQQVSCATAGYCLVSGTAAASTATADGKTLVVITRSGTTWTARRLATPRGSAKTTPTADPEGLECAAAGHCVLLINRYSLPLYFVSLDGVNATYHRVSTPADASVANYFTLNNGVADWPLSCSTVSTCWTVATYFLRSYSANNREESVAIRLNAGRVRVYPLPEPAPLRFPGVTINDIDCAGASSCVAVGSRPYNAAYFSYGPAVYETFANGVWTPRLAPRPKGMPRKARYEWTDVACAPAAGRCLATGGYRYRLRRNDEGHPYLTGAGP